jgi:hypothetical protein
MALQTKKRKWIHDYSNVILVQIVDSLRKQEDKQEEDCVHMDVLMEHSSILEEILTYDPDKPVLRFEMRHGIATWHSFKSYLYEPSSYETPTDLGVAFGVFEFAHRYQTQSLCRKIVSSLTMANLFTFCTHCPYPALLRKEGILGYLINDLRPEKLDCEVNATHLYAELTALRDKLKPLNPETQFDLWKLLEANVIEDKEHEYTPYDEPFYKPVFGSTLENHMFAAADTYQWYAMLRLLCLLACFVSLQNVCCPLKFSCLPAWDVVIGM